MDEALGEGPFELLVDLGTGTGRILELFGPARGQRAGLRPQSRHARLCPHEARARRAVPCPGAPWRSLQRAAARRRGRRGGRCIRSCISSTIPAAAIAEAARLLAPGGKLLVVDFAPHELEFLREQSAHRRLGFARDQLGRMLEGAGLKSKASGMTRVRGQGRFGKTSPRLPAGKLTVIAVARRRSRRHRQEQEKRTPRWRSPRDAASNTLRPDAKEPLSRPRRHRRVVRVLPAQDAGDGGDAVALHPAA